MRRLLPVLLLPVCLAGCATGYATDWFRDRPSIINPQLIRYGYDLEQSRCIGGKLGAALSRQELRRFQERAASVRPAANVVLGPANLRGVAGTGVRDLLDRAVADCNATLAATPPVPPVVASITPSPTATTPTEPSPAPVSTGDPAAPLTSGGVAVDMTPIETPATSGATAGTRTTWLNLGAADSGQSIAIDAMSIEQAGAARTAWFRMTDPQTNAATNNLYRLRIDCQARTVQPLALRQVDETGTEISLREYTAAEAEAGPAEAGTVLEIAFLSLCT